MPSYRSLTGLPDDIVGVPQKTDRDLTIERALFGDPKGGRTRAAPAPTLLSKGKPRPQIDWRKILDEARKNIDAGGHSQSSLDGARSIAIPLLDHLVEQFERFELSEDGEHVTVRNVVTVDAHRTSAEEAEIQKTRSNVIRRLKSHITFESPPSERCGPEESEDADEKDGHPRLQLEYAQSLQAMDSAARQRFLTGDWESKPRPVKKRGRKAATAQAEAPVARTFAEFKKAAENYEAICGPSPTVLRNQMLVRLKAYLASTVKSKVRLEEVCARLREYARDASWTPHVPGDPRPDIPSGTYVVFFEDSTEATYLMRMSDIPPQCWSGRANDGWNRILFWRA